MMTGNLRQEGVGFSRPTISGHIMLMSELYWQDSGQALFHSHMLEIHFCAFARSTEPATDILQGRNISLKLDAPTIRARCKHLCANFVFEPETFAS
jgi:hypothetical protein